jgi:hypothetical protein
LKKLLTPSAKKTALMKTLIFCNIGWEEKVTILFQLSQIVLSIPATQVSVERLFSS